MLSETLSSHALYFSTSKTFDITRNIQSNYKLLSFQKNLKLSMKFLNADEKFFWNLNISFPFIEQGFGHLVTPIANIWTLTKSFDNGNITLISRRGWKRQGLKFFTSFLSLFYTFFLYIYERSKIYKERN